MFLPSCDNLAAREPTLASLVARLDYALSQIGPAGEIDPAELAYVLKEDVDRVEAVLGELLQLGGLAREERIFCRNGCAAITMEEYSAAIAKGTPPCCSECGEPMEPSPVTCRSGEVRGHALRKTSERSEGRR